MPKYLPVGAIREMTYGELERWWEVDFDVLVSTAVAEASGPVHPTVAEALRGDDWLEQWADALFAGTGELASSVERMAFSEDARLDRTRKRLGSVEHRRGEVNRLLRERAGKEGWEMMPAHNKDAVGASRSILAKHFKEEARELRLAEIAQRGLEPNHPFYGVFYADRFDAIEDGVRRGMLQAPLTLEVQAALRTPEEVFTERVARDINRQEDRFTELRHPLLLGRWYRALETLRDVHCERAGIAPTFSMSLPALDVRALRDLPEREAWGVINRRRFLRALSQRHRECEMHTREVVRKVSLLREEIEQPWLDASHAAGVQLAERHPRLMEALLRAFAPYCEPGSTVFQREHIRWVKHHLIPELKRAVADGSVVRLLEA
jgi:hypothetical protein